MSQTLAAMLATEGKRISATPNPCILGSLWYCPRLGTLWQVVRVYGHQHAAHNAVIELSGTLFTDQQVYCVKRRMGLVDLTQRYCFFGSVHDTTWETEE